jgi:hypothetical protein
MLASTSQSHQADEEGGVHEGRSTLQRFAYAFAAALAFVYCPRDAE